MRKLYFFLLGTVMMLTFQTSCTIEDNPVTLESKELADATILWYGCGGCNVDGFILENFHQFYRAQASNFDHVNVV